MNPHEITFLTGASTDDVVNEGYIGEFAIEIFSGTGRLSGTIRAMSPSIGAMDIDILEIYGKPTVGFKTNLSELLSAHFLINRAALISIIA